MTDKTNERNRYQWRRSPSGPGRIFDSIRKRGSRLPIGTLDERGFYRDHRGVSVSLTHVLTVAITTVLVTGLLIGVGGYINDFEQDTTREELSAVGERLAGEFVRAETLAQLKYSSVELRTKHPDRVGGKTYTIRLSNGASICDGSPPCFRLASSGQNVAVVVPLASSVPVEPSSASGGNVLIVYDGGKISIEGVGI